MWGKGRLGETVDNKELIVPRDWRVARRVTSYSTRDAPLLGAKVLAKQPHFDEDPSFSRQ